MNDLLLFTIWTSDSELMDSTYIVMPTTTAWPKSKFKLRFYFLYEYLIYKANVVKIDAIITAI
jgi:hypothetical protein